MRLSAPVLALYGRSDSRTSVGCETCLCSVDARWSGLTLDARPQRGSSFPKALGWTSGRRRVLSPPGKQSDSPARNPRTTRSTMALELALRQFWMILEAFLSPVSDRSDQNAPRRLVSVSLLGKPRRGRAALYARSR